MKGFKKLLGLLLCFTIIGGMAACGEPVGSSSVAENSTVASVVDSSSVTEEVSSMESSNVGTSSVPSSEISHTDHSQPKSSSQISSIKVDNSTVSENKIHPDEYEKEFIIVLLDTAKMKHKPYTLSDFSEVSITGLYANFPDENYYLLFLKTPSDVEAKKACDSLQKRSDVKTASQVRWSNDKSFIDFVGSSGYFMDQIDIVVTKDASTKQFTEKDFPNLSIKKIGHWPELDKQRYSLYLSNSDVTKTYEALQYLNNRNDIENVSLPSVITID